MFASSNASDPTAFPSLQRMENDLVAMAGGLVDAPTGYAAPSPPAAPSRSSSRCSPLVRVRAVEPQHGAPTSAHAAFLKAAKYLGVRPVVVDVDPQSLRADPRAMAEAVDESTVLVVASARRTPTGWSTRWPRSPGSRRARHPVPRRRVHRRLGAPHLDDVPP